MTVTRNNESEMKRSGRVPGRQRPVLQSVSRPGGLVVGIQTCLGR